MSIDGGVEPRPVGVVGLVGVWRLSPGIVDWNGVAGGDGITRKRHLARREVAGLIWMRGGRRVRIRTVVGRLVRMLGRYLRLGRGRRPPVRHGWQAVAAIEGQSRGVDKGGRQGILPLSKGGRRMHGLR